MGLEKCYVFKKCIALPYDIIGSKRWVEWTKLLGSDNLLRSTVSIIIFLHLKVLATGEVAGMTTGYLLPDPTPQQNFAFYATSKVRTCADCSTGLN